MVKEDIAEARRVIDDGNEDCIGLERLRVFRCEAATPAKHFRPEGGRCPYEAKFKTRDGQKFCQLHAEIWAVANANNSMSRYFISEYTDGPATRWNVIDRRTQEWIRRFATKAEAEAYARKLNKHGEDFIFLGSSSQDKS